jgi:hypothetical protein
MCVSCAAFVLVGRVWDADYEYFIRYRSETFGRRTSGGRRGAARDSRHFFLQGRVGKNRVVLDLSLGL